MIIIGTHFFAWGSQLMSQSMQCGKCGNVAQFILKKGMRFITVFFVIPICPISGVKHMAQCPNCKARYDVAANQN